MKTPYRYISYTIATILMGMTLTTTSYAYDFTFKADSNSREFNKTQIYRDSGSTYTVWFTYSKGPQDYSYSTEQVRPGMVLNTGSYNFSLSNDTSSSRLFFTYINSDGGLTSLCSDSSSCSTCQNIPDTVTDITVRIIPSTTLPGYALQCRY